MKKAAIYIRVSTQEQAKEGYSIAAQRNRLIDYCNAKNWVIQDVYIDDGYTGTNINRPALKAILNNLDNIDIVLVYKLDRLSRSQKDVLFLVEEEFLKKEIDFVSLLESFDTSTPFGRAMLGILAVFAQLERDTIVERLKLGKEQRAREGFWKGGANPPIGYDFVDDHLIINEFDAIQIRKIFELYLQGNGYHLIKEKLDELGYKINNKKWSSPQIKQTLSNKIYCGYINHHKEYYPGNHEPIISEELFNKVQEIRISRNSNSTTNAKYLLAGLLYCGYCGAKMKGMSTKNSAGQIYQYYLCYSRSGVKHMIKDSNCPSEYWPVDKVDEFVENSLLDIALDKNRYIEIYLFKEQKSSTVKDDSITIKEKIQDLDKQMDKIMALYRYDKIPASKVSEMIDSISKEKKALEKNYNNIKNLEDNYVDSNLDEALKILDNFKLIWANATLNQKHSMLRILIKKVVVTDKIDIIWNVSNI